MLLTKPQQLRFWRQWQTIIRAQHWGTLEAEQQRHALLQRAGFDSLTRVDKTAGFDRLLAQLGLLLDDLNVAIEAAAYDDAPRSDAPDPGYRRRLLWLIKKHAASLGGPAYLIAVARCRFNRVTGLNTIEGLSDAELTQLMITLKQRSRSKRRAQSSVPSEPNCPF